ncbi:MAG: L-glutamate gamma-semialdehyde dehydrogenase [Acidobacteria bacterium]|nr:MAG: L-glutamate gamma-semialdehyde dehydrogenase [Acidobacteriota bacterium]
MRREIAEFRNEPLTDFKQDESRRAMRQALEKVAKELGRTCPLVIGGERVESGETFVSIDPSDPTRAIGRFQKGTPQHADKAVRAAAEAFESWRWRTAEERAGLLFDAAGMLRQIKHEMSAWMVYEVGKTWVEADADTAEAIDFCEYYGREALRLAGEQRLVKIPTERNEQTYIPLGVGAVIPPWNFPLAIMAGMTVAALVTGNAVVLKPSSDSPAIAWKFFEILERCGMPPGVVNFLTGPGALAGETLVKHPLVRFIAFTGSRDVGLRINELAAKAQPGQRWLKRAILEMGGKNFIIVDREADLDAAASGIVVSAYGFQGQKCSACSRAIVLRDVYDKVLERVVEKTRALVVGAASDPETDVGPVVNAAAEKKILDYIEVGRREGRLVAGGGKAAGPGFFIQPTVIADVAPNARIAQEEIFGPVLAFIPAKDLDEAIEIANGTEYGLTGSVYSNRPEHIEKAKRLCHAGNFYVNRKCTGALVGVHPFGGFNMSGTDSKAGGPDYLLLVTQAKAISEVVRK